MSADAISVRPLASFLANRRKRRLFVQSTFPVGRVRAAAVFCAPRGEERQKSYRTHFHLAQHLSAQGVACFRFDYVGCGDSDGDFVETTIESMVEDTCDVIAHVRDECLADRLYLVGTRLGATVAALAVEEAEAAGVALLFPIVDGARYWAHVVRQQQMVDLVSGLKPVPRRALAQRLRAQGALEIESESVSIRMVDQLTAVDLRRSPTHFRGNVLGAFLRDELSSKAELTELLTRYDSLGCRTLQLEEERDYWTLRSMYDYYLPLRAFER